MQLPKKKENGPGGVSVSAHRSKKTVRVAIAGRC
jgi:hypothetical protein